MFRQRFRELHAALDAGDRGDPDDDRGPPADVAVALLAPDADEDGRDDREQRGRLRVELRQPEAERQRRDEEDAAADAEQAGEDAGEEPDADGERRSSTSDEQPDADPARSSCEERARASGSRAAAGARCRRSRPNAAGMPTSAAAPGFTSPWSDVRDRRRRWR